MYDSYIVDLGLLLALDVWQFQNEKLDSASQVSHTFDGRGLLSGRQLPLSGSEK